VNIDVRELFETLLDGEDLQESSSHALMHTMASGTLEPALAGGILTALRIKGETAAEIRGFALAMRELARQPILPPNDFVDIVGTGGDGSGSLNLSTGSALLAAACGLPVVKHGNRSISSQSGSADVLAALGLPIPLDEAQCGQCLEQVGFTFLFAPHFHPAMKHIAPVRAALGVRTVFNVLGPLTNPAEPPFNVIGAYSEKLADLMADTLAGMPIERAFVVHGAEGWDEATPVGRFVCHDVRPGQNLHGVRDPRDYGIERCRAEDLLGADPASNCLRLREALHGRDTQAHRDALALGAGLALEVSGRAADLGEGVTIARAALSDGSAARLLERIAAFSASLRI
jgi:anthranilate phosphoribosyltransferase